MNVRNLFLAVAPALLAASLAASLGGAAEPRRPNFVLIVADDKCEP